MDHGGHDMSRISVYVREGAQRYMGGGTMEKEEHVGETSKKEGPFERRFYLIGMHICNIFLL
jgi:hypothetical protein